MSDESQLVVPPSFMAMYVPAGRLKPTAPLAEIVARYEFCEDLAAALTESAGTIMWQHGTTEQDVLERMYLGLQAPASGVTAEEACWIIRRLAELMDWPQTAADACLGAEPPRD